MEQKPFKSMPLQELWQLHRLVNAILAARLLAEKDRLERRLELLSHLLRRAS